MERPGFFMLSSDSSLLVITMAGYLLFTGFQAYYYMIQTSRYLHNIKSQSQRTTQLQKQLFKALCIQAFIPVLAFIAPCLYIQISTALHYVDMILGNISMIWLTTHGIISTTTMLIVHKPYREAVLGMVKCKKSVTNAPSQNNSLVKL
uniref:Serpentine Receptor, class H n=1 Tax=Caenorhabditis tropicalis TaxID=1561998 RepID=A0A1I7T6L1_9PELO